MRQLRWGILGAGQIAGQFVAGLSLSAASTVVAAASRSQSRAAAFAKDWGIRRSYGTYDELVRDPEVDVIYIATPNSLHYQHARLCLEHGKHILCEKPFCTSYEDAAAILELAKQRQLFCMEAMWMRFNPLISEVKQRINQGDLGELLSFHGNLGMARPYQPKSRLFAPGLGGGALLDLGVYPLSLIQYLGKGDWTVRGSTLKSPSGVDIHLTAMLHNQAGQQAQIMCSLMAETDGSFQIVGSRGRITIHGPIYRPTSYSFQGYQDCLVSQQLPVESGEGSGGALRKLMGRLLRLPGMLTLRHRLSISLGKRRQRPTEVLYAGNGYHYQADEVCRVIAEGGIESPVMSHQDSLETMKLLEALAQVDHLPRT